MSRIARFVPVLALSALFGATAAAQSPLGGVVVPPAPAYLSELHVNPPGLDNGVEAIEITGAPGQSLAGYKIVVIEGDGGPGVGVVDQVFDLGAFSIGANGVFLWRDAASVIESGIPAVVLPGYNPATTLHVADFIPDIENGTNSYVLGFGTAPAIVVDIDTNNDGVPDVGWFQSVNTVGSFTVVDAVGFTDGGVSDITYGAALGFSDVGTGSGALYRIPTCSGGAGTWAGGFTTAAGTSFVISGGHFGFPFAPGASWTLDLGRRNECVATLALNNGGTPGNPFSIDVSGAPAGEVYLTALTFNAGNSPTPPYTGPHAGLVIGLDELYTELFLMTPPFVGGLDAFGAATFTVDPMPVLGATIYGATLIYSPFYGDFVGRTAIVSANL